MKIIEAMKKVKELLIKADDLRQKVHTYCADQTHETPMYGTTQGEKIKEWVQAHHDILKEIIALRVGVQRTNLATKVTIELGGKPVTKTIAEWIHRRRDVADLEYRIWNGIGDRNLREGFVKSSTGESVEVKIRRHYDPQTRDRFVDLFRSEPGIIDRTLEVTNAVTELT